VVQEPTVNTQIFISDTPNMYSGWGVYLPYSMKDITIVNNAIGGRSARSFTDEGRFKSLISAVVSGDYVIIEFGHNDGGSLSPTDNGRTACGGAGSETCVSPTGAIVQTYPTYLTVRTTIGLSFNSQRRLESIIPFPTN